MKVTKDIAEEQVKDDILKLWVENDRGFENPQVFVEGYGG